MEHHTFEVDIIILFSQQKLIQSLKTQYFILRNGFNFVYR